MGCCIFRVRGSSVDSDARRVRRSESGRVRGRTRLRCAAGGPVRVVGGQAPPAFGPIETRRCHYAGPAGAVAGQLLGPPSAQAVDCRPAGRARHRTRLGRPADGTARYPKREAAKAGARHRGGPHSGTARRPRRAGLRRRGAQPAVGRRPLPGRHLVRRRVRVLHHRCVPPPHRQRESRSQQGDPDGPRRFGDASPEPRRPPRRLRRSHRRSHPDHRYPLQRAPRRHRHHTSLGMLPPVEFENRHQHKPAA